MGVRLSAINLLVKDIDASYHFYRELIGLEIDAPATDGPADERHVHAAWGSREDGTSFLLTIRAAGTEPPSRSRIGFAVDDVDALNERLVRAGARIQRPLQDQPWGRSAVYLDPDGNFVSLIQPPAARS